MKWVFRIWFLSLMIAIYKRLIVPFTNAVFHFIYSLGNTPTALSPVRDPILLESAVSLAKKIREKKVSSRDVVEAYFSRIDEVQPVINAVVEDRRKEALQEAARVEYLLATRTKQQLKEDYPLLGVPFSVKEAIALKGMLWTAGLVSRKGTRAEEDAETVKRLKAAGAIPIVTTNTSECCMWIESFNRLYGMTNNPYDTRRTAGGSSGGEGALLGAAGSILGIGNDIGGSIRLPAHYNGVFGHKPSIGVVPNEGSYPILEKVYLERFLGTGPMCRYAEDLIPSMKILAGDGASLMQLDTEVSIKDLKVYYLEEMVEKTFILPSSPGTKAAIKKVVTHFKSMCSTPPEKVHIRGMNHCFTVWGYSMSPGLHGADSVEKRVFGYESMFKVFKELFLSLFGFSKHTLPVIIMVLIDKYILPSKKYPLNPFSHLHTVIQDDFTNLLKDNCVFLLPTMPEPAPHHYGLLFKPQNYGITAIFNLLGVPVTSCPVMLDDEGLPIGIQIVAGLYKDHLNFAVAREIEKRFGGWVCPGKRNKRAL